MEVLWAAWGRDGSPGTLAATGFVYVPRFFDAECAIERVVPNRPAVPAQVVKRITMDLDRWPYPRRPIVPLAEAVHERYAVEIFPRLYEGMPVLPRRGG